MKKSISHKTSRWLLFMLLTSALIPLLLSTPVFSADQPVAKLTELKGVVMVKSRGAWNIKPKKGLPLYSRDKVVTRAGRAVVNFDDGAVIEIRANSNLEIIEREEEEGIMG